MSQDRTQYENRPPAAPPARPLRPSRVLRKTRAGGIALCFKVNLADPRVVEIAAMAGYDCVWLCNEHVPSDWLCLENMVRAGKVYDLDTMLRVARGGYPDYVRGLEMDAAGLMVPHVMSVEDARQVVRMTKFPPVGRRAVDGGNADGGYCRVNFTDYLEAANRERFVLYQIEDPEAVEHAEAIAALPGVDGLFFGPGDFSVAIGKPGQVTDPQIIAARDRTIAAARRAGKLAGTPSSPANIRALVDLGCNFLSLGADVVGVSQYCDRLLAEAQAALGAGGR